ncbi:MAG: Lrp/AsnC family transcriptional regulator [Nanoarchaeota archaeon]
MLKLDLKDRKLLYELDTNSRQSASELARKIGLSKDAIIYRMKKLENAGIIKQYHTIIDVGKLGFISFRLYLKLQNTTPEKEAEIIEYFKKKNEITWLVSIDGKYDLGMWILTKSIKEMNAFWKELLQNYINFIAERALTIFTKVSYFPRSYLLDQQSNQDQYIFITEPEEIKIDEKDLQILKLLAPAARRSILEIAQKVKITAKTAAARIKGLEKKKIIIGYRTRFDLEKLGYQYFKVHFNLQNLTTSKEKQFRQYIKQHPHIIYDNEVLGGDDLEIEIQVKTLPELRSILEEIQKNFAEIIREHYYFLFYKEHKLVFFPS